MTEFKNIFRKARKAKGYTLEQLAEMLSVVPSYVDKLEKGFALPSNDLILKLGSLLDLNVQEMYLRITLEKTDDESLRKILTALLTTIESGTVL